MNRTPSIRLLALLVGGLTMAGITQNVAAQEDVDPPGRVARLSYLQGEVQIEPSGTDVWADAQLNRPLTSDDKLWVDRNSRAELQLGSAAFRLNQATSLSVLELSDDVAQLRLAQGAINVRVKRLRDNEAIEIDTPNAAISLSEIGSYRVEVADDGNSTLVRVRQGRAEINGDRQSFTLDANEEAQFQGAARLNANFASVGPMDDFDAWAADRDRIAEKGNTRYVSADVIGYEDLNGYGEWNNDPDYGYVWVPTRVAGDWAPYRFGHWVWVSPWGWTWIDQAPWGFAPFHYGRWAYRRSRWCWVPGPIGVRPVYAPALVAWVGRPGVNVSVSIGSNPVGWLPLGPREVYVPGYRSSRGYIRNVNVSNTFISNNTVINNALDRPANLEYMNRQAPRGISVVERDAFAGGRPVAERAVKLDDRAARQLAVAPTAPEIRPIRESRLGNGRVLTGPPANVLNKPVIALRSPRSPEQNGRQAEAARIEGREPQNRAPLTVVMPAPSNRTFRSSPPPGSDVAMPPKAEGEGPSINTNRENRVDRAWRSNRPEFRGGANPSERAPVVPNPTVNAVAPPSPAEHTAPAASPEPRTREDRAPSSPWMRDEARLQRERRSAIQSAPAPTAPVPPAPTQAAPRQPAPHIEKANPPPQAAPPKDAPAPNANPQTQERRGKPHTNLEP